MFKQRIFFIFLTLFINYSFLMQASLTTTDSTRTVTTALINQPTLNKWPLSTRVTTLCCGLKYGCIHQKLHCEKNVHSHPLSSSYCCPCGSVFACALLPLNCMATLVAVAADLLVSSEKVLEIKDPKKETESS